MTIKKLAKMPYAQAHIEIDSENNISLWSYRTLVATINNEGWLTVYGLYSNTTRRHISAFMAEYTDFDYYMAKKAYEGGYTINLETGEIILYDEQDL